MVQNVLRLIKNDICFKIFVCCCNMADEIRLCLWDKCHLWVIIAFNVEVKVTECKIRFI